MIGGELYRGAWEWYRWLEAEVTEWLLGEGAWTRGDRGVCRAGAGRPQHPIPAHPCVDKQGKPASGYLCEKDFTSLGKMLHDIETEAGDLDISPSMALSFEHGGGGLASQQTPVRLDPLVLNDWRHGRGLGEGEEEARASGNTASLMATLCRYAMIVRQARELTVPMVEWMERMPGQSTQGPVCARQCGHATCEGMVWWRSRPVFTVQSERQVLTRQLDWIAEQPWAGAFYDHIHQLLGQLQRANGTASPRPIPGTCPVQIEQGKAGTRECGGPLWPAKPKETSESEKWTGSSPSAIRCGSCNTRWEGPGPLARLALILDAQPATRRSTSARSV